MHEEAGFGARAGSMSSGKSNWSNRMNIHQLMPSVSRWLLSMGSLLLAAAHASSADLSKFKRI